MGEVEAWEIRLSYEVRELAGESLDVNNVLKSLASGKKSRLEIENN